MRINHHSVHLSKKEKEEISVLFNLFNLFYNVFTSPLFMCIVFENSVHCPSSLISHLRGCSCNRSVFFLGIFDITCEARYNCYLIYLFIFSAFVIIFIACMCRFIVTMVSRRYLITSFDCTNFFFILFARLFEIVPIRIFSCRSRL